MCTLRARAVFISYAMALYNVCCLRAYLLNLSCHSVERLTPEWLCLAFSERSAFTLSERLILITAGHRVPFRTVRIDYTVVLGNIVRNEMETSDSSVQLRGFHQDFHRGHTFWTYIFRRVPSPVMRQTPAWWLQLRCGCCHWCPPEGLRKDMRDIREKNEWKFKIRQKRNSFAFPLHVSAIV